jgi:hypothetical protein
VELPRRQVCSDRELIILRARTTLTRARRFTRFARNDRALVRSAMMQRFIPSCSGRLLRGSISIWYSDRDRASHIARCRISICQCGPAAVPHPRSRPADPHSCRHVVPLARALHDGVDVGAPASGRGVKPSRITPEEAFWLATAGGGEALDLPIGLIRPDMRFDALWST